MVAPREFRDAGDGMSGKENSVSEVGVSCLDDTGEDESGESLSRLLPA